MNNELTNYNYIFFLTLIFILFVYGNAVAIENDSGDVKTKSKKISYIYAGTNYEWGFTCGGGECLVGKFVGGDYWIAPKKNGEEVVVASVLPLGSVNGLMQNPVSNTQQGFLSCQTKSYSKDKNLMSSLPLKVKPNTSLVKSTRRYKNCAGGDKGCCISSYSVLTVLDKVPNDDGQKTFRPGFTGKNKVLYDFDDFDFNHITEKYKLNKRKFSIDFNEIHKRWHAVYVDHYMTGLGDPGRAFAPHDVLPNYGAALASLYLNDLLAVLSNDSLQHKLPAITGLLQRSIDLYTSWKNGIRWRSGAGQQLGRKPPIVFFGSLLKNKSVKHEIMSMAGYGKNDTQEDGQIRIVNTTEGGSGKPVWGDVTGWCKEDFYWGQLFGSGNYAGSLSVNKHGDNKKTCGDPYGWIDGPAGKPGTFYMSCCSTGGYIAYSIAQNLMPELCYVSNDPELSQFVKRVIIKGIHTLPDPCAPPDTRESKNCRTHSKGSPGCLYYKKTWGPSQSEPGQCIKNGTNGTKQNGRFPHLHNTPLTPIYYEPAISQYLRTTSINRIFNNCNPNVGLIE